MEMKQCLILAAGLSSRMGQWKMMLPWREGTVLDSTLRNALAFCDRVILVTGYRGEALRQRYAGRDRILLCHNPVYTQGMFSSLQRGARRLQPGHFFIIPGDMPAVTPDIYAALWQHRSARVLVPFCEGGRGHPALLPPDMRRRILDAPANVTLKHLVSTCGRDAVPVQSAAIHWDVDTPQQYAQLRERVIPDRIS